MIEKISHYSLTTPASVHDEEALTALELAGRTAEKVNQCVDEVNTIPKKVSDDVEKHIENGDFDKQINEYAGDLETRLENILNSSCGGSEEVVDMRVGIDGVTYLNAGRALRTQLNQTMFMRGLIDSVDKLPDVNEVFNAGVHILHFSEGATDIPAGLPFTKWTGRIAALLTFTNFYNRQVLITDKHVYTRNAGGSGVYGEWSTLNEITQNGGANDTNYTTNLPDVNDALDGFYSLHFAAGSSAIPANLPWSTWRGRVATLLTTSNEYKRQLLFTDTYMYTRYKSGSGWSSWVNILGKETVTVGAGGDYQTVLAALINHPTNTRIILKSGTYYVDMEYMSVFGSSYFDNYTGYAGKTVHDRGLFLGDGVELIGEGNVTLLFQSLYNNNVSQYFSILNTSQNNRIENINIESAYADACRYLLHDDFATSAGTNVFKNLTFKGQSFLGTAIGGGFGTKNTYIIDNCVFNDLNETIAIAYHNNANVGENRLFIRDCYCDGKIDIKHYGSYTKKSRVYITGCKYKNYELRFGDTSNPVENIEVVAHGNNTDVRMDALDEKINVVEQREIATRGNVTGNGSATRTGLVTFITDDGRIEDYTLFKPIFAKYGIGCTTAVCTDKVGKTVNGQQFTSLEQYRELQDVYGWEICSHARHSDLTSLSDDELDNELRGSMQWLKDNNFNGYDILMYPYGKYDERVQRFASKYYRFARVTDYAFATDPLNTYATKGFYFNNGTNTLVITGFAVNTIEHWKSLIDQANANGKWLIIWTHSWEVAQWGNSALFEQVVKYASENARCVSCSKALELIGNTVDQTSWSKEYDEHFVIGNNGRVSSNIARTVYLKPNSVTFGTLPSEFRHNFVSVVNIYGSDNLTNSPAGKAGTLVTYRFAVSENEITNTAYVWQEFYEYGTKFVYRRVGKYTNAWDTWRYADPVTASTTTRDGSNFLKYKGLLISDMTLNKPIYYDGEKWVDMAGNTV